MNYLRTLMLGLGVLLVALFSVTIVHAEGEIVTVLFPTAAGSGTYKISADESDPIKSTGTATLSFDLNLLPRTAIVKRVTVQLAGKSVGKDNPQIVTIVPQGSTTPVASWTATSGESVFQASTEPLRALVQEALKPGKPVTVTVTFSSKSRLSNWEYASMSEYEGISSSKPRLIVEYQPPQELQDRARELDTTNTRWKFWRTDDAASKPFMNTMAAIISNPVFYDGTMYLFAQPSSQETKLYALRLGGGNLWEPKALSIRPGSHAMVSPAGRLYSIGEDRVVLYDLKQAGAEIRNVPLANFKPALRPILGEDGSLYAMPPGALFGFNPDLQEMWRYPGAKTDMPDASRVVLSPDAGRYAYMLAKRGTATQLVRLETATGNATVSGLPVIDVTKAGKTSTENLDLGFTSYTRPVVTKGPEQDYVFYGASTAQSGYLLAYSGNEVVWWRNGLVSQPIVNRDGNVVAVQSGKLHVYAQLNGTDDGTDKKSCVSTESGLDATSNLVLDGDDNVYFWSNGDLKGFTKNCLRFVSRKLDGLPKQLELLFAPDGTLFARTETNALYTLILMPRDRMLAITQDKIQADTIYNAESIKAGDDVHIPVGTNVVFKAQKQMAFGRGFSVKPGATLRCQVGG